MTILVVDDHPHFRQTAVRLLSFLGHATVEASDEREAEEALRQHAEIEIVLLDVHLDGAHGLELAERLEAARPGVRVLFMSGYGEVALDAPELSGPRRHFIDKPFSVATLGAALEELARR